MIRQGQELNGVRLQTHLSRRVLEVWPCTERRAMVGRGPGGGAAATPLPWGEATSEPSWDEPRAAHFGGGGSGVITTGVCAAA